MIGAEAHHAALMDQIYRRQRHVYDVTRRYYLLGRDHLIRDLSPPSGSHILEMGCGTGRNLIKAARVYPECRLYGIDISGAMLASAQRSRDQSDVSTRIALAKGDATCFEPAAPFGLERFDRIYFSYTVSMMPNWLDALEHAASLVKPGGALSVVDFGQQDRLPSWFRSLLFAWLAKFHVSPRATLHAELSRITRNHRAELFFQPLFGGYAWYGRIQMPGG